MKYFSFLFFLVFPIFASPIRYALPLENGSSLICYIETPQAHISYPLVILIEGSHVQEQGPQSVLRIHNKFAEAILKANCGLITVERRGADGDHIDSSIYHRFNMPSQRLEDHLRLMTHIRGTFPEGWNGQFVIIGGSEGGPIAIKLAYATDPSACIALVGCGDQSFKEYIWNFIQFMQASGVPLSNELPADRAAYEALCEMMKANPDPNQWWLGQTFLYWADALDQTEEREFLGLKCPVLVVAGSEDLECPSTDRLIEKACQNNQDVTYLRIKGMGHNVLDPEWQIMEKIQQFIHDKVPIKDMRWRKTMPLVAKHMFSDRLFKVLFARFFTSNSAQPMAI